MLECFFKLLPYNKIIVKIPISGMVALIEELKIVCQWPDGIRKIKVLFEDCFGNSCPSVMKCNNVAIGVNLRYGSNITVTIMYVKECGTDYTVRPSSITRDMYSNTFI